MFEVSFNYSNKMSKNIAAEKKAAEQSLGDRQVNRCWRRRRSTLTIVGWHETKWECLLSETTSESIKIAFVKRTFRYHS